MFTYTTPLARIASGDRARITLAFRQGRDATGTDHKPAGQYLEASFAGEVIGKHCDPAKDGSVRSCGQIIDVIADYFPAAAHAWRRWHLNGTQSHCAHQDRAIPWDQCPPCPETGYRCGSAWLADPLTVAGAVECMLAVGAEGYVIGRDGRAVEVTAADPLGRLLALQGQSASYATQHGGWTVTRVDGLTTELIRYWRLT